MSIRVRVIVAALLCGCCGLLPRSASAQGFGTISGSVADPSGAAVPSANVTVTEVSTGLSRTAVTNQDGYYVLNSIKPSGYVLSVDQAGFKKFTQTGIVLLANQSLTVNIALSLGSTSESVSVNAAATQVDLTTPTLRQVVDSSRMVEMPLNGRNAAQLTTLVAGAVTAPSNNADQGPTKTFPEAVTISTNGARENQISYLLDGVPNVDFISNVNQPFPFPDALQEFSVQTSSLPARFGLRPAGVVNAVTKSGTNEWHGSLFEFLRNGNVNARNFFGLKHDSLKRNQFGGTFGGRVIRDKLFFFGGYQKTFNRQDPPSTTNWVPTQAVLNGDFSTIAGGGCVSGGKGRTILDPTNGQAFADNQIPVSRFNPQSLNLLKYIPVSNDPCGKIVYGIPQTGDEHQVIGRIDWVQSSRHNFYGRYFIDDYSNPAVFDGKNILVTTRAGNLQRAQTLTLGDTFTFGTRTVNSFHATATRRRNNRGSPENDINPASLGVNVFNPVPNFIQVAVSGYFTVGCGTCASAFFNVNTFHFADDVDLIRGRHQIGFGVDYIRNQFNSINIWNANGNYSFNGQYVSGKSMGDALASYMLGTMNSFTQSANLQNATRGTVAAFYIQDSIRLSPRLTVNAGLRWDPTLTPYDYFDRGNSFSRAAFNAGQRSKVFTAAPAGLLFYGDPGIPRGFQNSAIMLLSPRVGLVWDPTGSGKQTIRISSAILRDSEEMFYNERLTTNSPYGTSIDVPFPAGGFSDPWRGYSGGNPFPLPSPLPSNFSFPNAGVYVGLPLKMNPTYMAQWSLSYQRQFGANWMASGTYIGNKTTHVWVAEDINPAIYIPGSSASTNLRRPLYLQNPQLGAAYSSITISDQNGNANYNAMLLSLQHRFAHNFSVLTNYTWSHCISDADFRGELSGSSYANPYNRAADRAGCGFDVRQMMNATVVAVSPGIGNAFATRLTRDWQLSPILSFRTGVPMLIGAGTDISQTGIGLDRPDLVSLNVWGSGDPTSWLNRAAFQNPAAGTFGKLGRDALYGPSQFKFDVAVARTFRVRERIRLDARFEGFNILNHANFNLPNVTYSNSQFGVISSAQDPRILQFALKLVF